jgi:hypothetical protein
MKRELVTILMASLMIAASGVVPAQSAADDRLERAPSPQAAGQAAEPQVASPAAVPSSGTATEGQTVTEEEAEPDEEAPAASGGAVGAVPDAAASDSKPAAEQALQPISGAFGIPLGERFDPCMVAKVLSQEEKTYRGPNKEERKGILYRVEPKVTNTLFNTYAVATTADGVIYLIRGDQEPKERKPACEVPNTLAAFLGAKYGKMREKGPAGQWYNFRDMSRRTYRGVRLHATRCGRGIYSIVYSDDEARRGAPGAKPEPKPEPSETSGL